MKKILAALLLCGALSARVREVGPGKKYRTPCSAISAASKGDVIELDTAGKYDGDVCAFSIDNLTIRGVNGRARIDAGGQSAKDKGIWVIGGDNTTVENVEFSGAKSSSKNGAGIRLERGSLILHNCYFHDNENGILTAADPAGEVLIEFSEFATPELREITSSTTASVRKPARRAMSWTSPTVGPLTSSATSSIKGLPV